MRSTSRFLSWAYLHLAALLLSFFPDLAFAAVDSMGDAADSVAHNGLSGVALLMGGISYLGGALFGVKSAIQLRDHTENPQQTRLSKPLTSATVSTSLLALPGFYQMIENTFGLVQTAFSPNIAAQNGSAGTLDQMAAIFASNVPSMMALVGWGAAIAGGFIILRAIFMLPQLEQGRVEGSKIMWMLFSGILLWSLLPAISMVLGTEGANSAAAGSILTAQYNQSGNGGFDGTIAAVLTFVQFIGLIAFVRGALILKAMGENKEGSMGRAMTHLLAGAAAINISWTVFILANSIGASGSICGLTAAHIICP